MDMVHTRYDMKWLFRYIYFFFGVCGLTETGCASSTGCDPLSSCAPQASSQCAKWCGNTVYRAGCMGSTRCIGMALKVHCRGLVGLYCPYSYCECTGLYKSGHVLNHLVGTSVLEVMLKGAES